MIDINTLRKGDLLTVKAEFDFSTDVGHVYIKLPGDFSCRRIDAESVLGIISYLFEVDDVVSIDGIGNATVKFVDERGMLVEFEDGARMAIPLSCAKRVPAVVTPINPAREIADEIREASAAAPIDPPAIAAE